MCLSKVESWFGFVARWRSRSRRTGMDGVDGEGGEPERLRTSCMAIGTL